MCNLFNIYVIMASPEISRRTLLCEEDERRCGFRSKRIIISSRKRLCDGAKVHLYRLLVFVSREGPALLCTSLTTFKTALRLALL